MIKITPAELTIWSTYVASLTGIQLDSTKDYLFENRLNGLLGETKSASFSELYSKVVGDPTGALKRKVIDSLTTGETSFFRDHSPYDLLVHKILPDLIDRRNKQQQSSHPIPIRVWSAACSTGQEVYSIAITIVDTLRPLSRYSVKILGTDISDQAISAASRGRFKKLEIERGLPKEKLEKYFAPREDDSWQIKEEIRALASFRTFNLLTDLSPLGRFDIIFCRNVAIYFSESDRKKLFMHMTQALEPDGYLIIGSTESLTNICPQFESKRYLSSVFYQLTQSRPAAKAA
ncbi:MAG: protein-glutamate O-methyltransferase CheR [Deltaproteobacteria bacterium]|nr:protein-glutamate O-methyltransferase CheR [Deltaproteobacteria bacterium]